MIRCSVIIVLLFTVYASPKGFTFHFVHVPKAGGSTVTSYLRQYVDCQPPGFCCTAPGLPIGICNQTRLCAAVIGCTRHEPHIDLLKDSNYYSVINIRDPLQRAISGFNYPYHHGSHKQFITFVRDSQYQNVVVKMLNGFTAYSSTKMEAKHIDTALRRLQQFDFIVMSEIMKESITDLYNTLPGGKRPHFLPDARVHVDEVPRKEATMEEILEFRTLNHADILLYEAATTEYCKRLPTASICVSSSTSLNKLRADSDKLREILEKHTRERNEHSTIPSILSWRPPESWYGGSCKNAYFYHFPGHYKPKRDAAVKKYFSEAKAFPPLSKDVIIAFPYASSNPEDSLAERIYKQLGYPYINYLQGETVFTRWWSKVGPLMDVLRTGRITQKYIVVHDASDVVLMTPPLHIIEYFEAYDCDILMGTTDADWPPEKQLFQFEAAVAPWSKHHAHITAGMFMARTSTLLAYMEDLEQESKGFPGAFNDQRHWRRLHQRTYPRVKTDSMCKIFVRTDEFMNEP